MAPKKSQVIDKLIVWKTEEINFKPHDSACISFALV